MNLIGRKIKSTPFPWPIGKKDIPKLSEEEFVRVLIATSNGCKESRDKLILSLTPLAMNIVGRYLTVLHTNRLQDELVGAALLAVTRLANQIMQGRSIGDFKITGLFVIHVHNALASVVANSDIIRVPYRTQRERVKTGREPVPVPKVSNLEHSERLRVNSTNDDVVARQGWWRLRINSSKSLTDFEIEELVAKICNTEFERSVLALRVNIKGGVGTMSTRAIAGKLGCSHVTVAKTLHELRHRISKELSS